MKTTFKRVAAAGASAALIATGMSVAVGTGVASAYDADTCSTSATEHYSNAGSLGTKYYISKEIQNDGEVAPDGTVSFLIKAHGAGALIKEIRDFHPDGFTLKKAELNVNWVLGGQKWENATSKAVQSGNQVSVSGSGWTTAGGATIALRTTYKAPSNLKPGTKIDAGGSGMNVELAGGNHNWKDMNLCLTVRKKNLGEQVGGSLDDMGSGFITAGSSQLDSFSSDPSSPLNTLDLGSLLKSFS